MKLLPPKSTRTDTPFPYTTLILSERWCPRSALRISSKNFRPAANAGASTASPTSASPCPTDRRHAATRNIVKRCRTALPIRSEEHTSELQSLMRISYAVFCLKKKNIHKKHNLIQERTNTLQQNRK